MTLYQDIKREAGVYAALEQPAPVQNVFIQAGKRLTQGLRSKHLMMYLNAHVQQNTVKSAPSTEELRLSGYRRELTRRFFASKDDLTLIEKTTAVVYTSDNGFEEYVETIAAHDVVNRETTTISRATKPSLIGESATVTQSSINQQDEVRFLSLIDEITRGTYVAPEHKIYTQDMRPAVTFEYPLS